MRNDPNTLDSLLRLIKIRGTKAFYSSLLQERIFKWYYPRLSLFQAVKYYIIDQLRLRYRYWKCKGNT